MRPLKWKVCGLRDNIAEVVALLPDYIGFIFYPKSPRYVGADFVMPEIQEKSIKKIGVFVNESVDTVQQIVNKYQLDFAQIHGHESASYCLDLKNKGIKVIKAFQVDEQFDFDILKPYEKVVDFFLFDTKTSQFGGSGSTFDWSILQKYSMGKTYFLSGGISLNNLEGVNVLDLAKIHSIDVNSKFELSPGLKNLGKLVDLRDLIINKEVDKG